MTTSLGMKIGSTTCVAVSGGDRGLEAALVRGPILELIPDSSPELVDGPGPHRVGGFSDRVGDPVALVTEDGRHYNGEDLYAAAMAALAADAGAWDADAVVLACPNEWQDYTIDVLRAAAERQELSGVSVVPEAVAAITALAQGPVDRFHSQLDGVAVVYDLGGSSLDVAVVRTGSDPTIIGRPLRSDEISGAQFDHLVLGHVLDSVGATDAIDPFDAATVEGLAELRIRCAAAREALSSDTETVVSIDLPGLRTEARLVRSELEDLLREPLSNSMALVIEALQLADVDLGAVSTILLIGGGSATPLVSELASSMLRVPVAVNNDPATTSATGAALIAASMAQAAAAAAASVVPATASTSDEIVPVSNHAITPAPRTVKTEPASMSRGKRTAIVVGVAAAIALLTAGGLSVGTALTDNSTPKPAAAESSVAGAPATSTTTAKGAPAGSSTDGNGSTNTKSTGTVTTGADGKPTTAAPKGTAAAPAPQAPGAPATAPQPGTSAPAPAPGGTTAAPAPAPAPGGGGGGDTGGGQTPPAENPAPAPAPAPGSGTGSGLLQLPGQVLGGTGAAVGGLLGGLGG
jgi:actin-like ATPase involved in cell morphogenesis